MYIDTLQLAVERLTSGVGRKCSMVGHVVSSMPEVGSGRMFPQNSEIVYGAF